MDLLWLSRVREPEFAQTPRRLWMTDWEEKGSTRSFVMRTDH